ncbi:MAG: DegV family EDD domain-containing protein [Lachnospiraceae bacterium]|nr:DegV family EDD domain-containing protein [Lachnospiraceae bacterium]
MSHEIRTPINTIIGLNEMILREDISDEVAEDAKNIQAASKMLLHLINDILDMSKLESGRMEVTPTEYDVGVMLSELVNMLWLRAKEKDLEFHVNVDPMLPAILYGDEVKIKQVLVNLLTNAIKYTDEGSVTLSIQYEIKEDGPASVVYTISDTGIGIKKENMPYLFSAFKRVDEKKNRYIEGTGLGLAIVQQFVELMDGDIKVNSVYTQGSTFIIRIPQGVRTDKQIGRLNLEEKHSMNTRAHYKQSFEAPEAKVLVVDDNATNLLVVKKLLRDTKVKVDTAESGDEALQMTVATHYDLILMDHLMPNMDGIECLHQIRSQIGGLCKDTKVTVLTANAFSENQLLYSKAGFEGYLAKPVSGAQLETELLRLLPRTLVHLTGTDVDDFEQIISHSRDYQKRMAFRITTDSVCDLPKSLIASANIAVLPYHVRTENGMFYDEIEMEARGILTYMEENDTRIYSEPPSVEEYEKFFASQLLLANNIVHITMSGKVSDGYKFATEAARAFENVTVIDSGHLSSGMGLLVLAASHMGGQGMSAEAITQEIERIKNRVHTSFVVDDTDYLARSGRISKRMALIASGFLLQPALELKNGKMGVGKIFFGTRPRVWKSYIKQTLTAVCGVENNMLFITHACLGKEDLVQIENEVRKYVKVDEIIFQKASSAITTNCGPATFGLLFLEKE